MFSENMYVINVGPGGWLSYLPFLPGQSLSSQSREHCSYIHRTGVSPSFEMKSCPVERENSSSRRNSDCTKTYGRPSTLLDNLTTELLRIYPPRGRPILGGVALEAICLFLCVIDNSSTLSTRVTVSYFSVIKGIRTESTCLTSSRVNITRYIIWVELKCTNVNRVSLYIYLRISSETIYSVYTRVKDEQ